MVKYELTEFCGLKNTVRLYNAAAELMLPTELGIRILSYRLSGGENVLKVFDGQIKNRAKNEWQSYGGHRLWHAPEETPRTYEIDNAPISYEFGDDGLRLTQKPDPVSRIGKTLTVKMDEKTSAVSLTHGLTNFNRWPVELSAWALTVLRAGGMLAVEQPPAFNALLPDRTLTLWPYARMNDSRVYWGDRVITLTQKNAPPFKFGLYTAKGAAIYILPNVMFKKTFGGAAGNYPDFNCNFESYTDAEMLECESLSPLVKLNYGEKIVWRENWTLSPVSEIPAPDGEKALLKLL